MEEVQVGKDSQIRLTEKDKDGYVQNGIWVEITQTNHPELQQIPQEWMNRKSQPAPKIILKYNHFIGMTHQEGPTEGGRHPAVARSGRMPASTNLLISASPVHDSTHSSSRRALVLIFLGLVFFGFTAPFFGAISQI